MRGHCSHLERIRRLGASVTNWHSLVGGMKIKRTLSPPLLWLCTTDCAIGGHTLLPTHRVHASTFIVLLLLLWPQMWPLFKKAACVLDIIFSVIPISRINWIFLLLRLTLVSKRVDLCTYTARIIGWGRSRTIYPSKGMEFIQSTRLFVFLLLRIPEDQKKFVPLFLLLLFGGTWEYGIFFPHSLLSSRSWSPLPIIPFFTEYK